MCRRLASSCIVALKMEFQSESTKKLVFVYFLFSQVLITNSVPGKLSNWMMFAVTSIMDMYLHAITTKHADYVFITQPPTELLCNPHTTNDASSDIGLECSIGIIGKDLLPVETRIVWFRRTPSNSAGEQLCETEVSLLMAALPAQSVLLRSTVHLRATLLGDLTGEYWCRVAKTIQNGRTALSSNSSVLSISNSQYYRDRNLGSCDNGAIFLDISASHQSVNFSLSAITTEQFRCPLCSNCTDDVDTITLSRMWVIIIVPVISAVLIMTFLVLLIALITTCIQKRRSTKKHPSTIGGLCRSLCFCNVLVCS